MSCDIFMSYTNVKDLFGAVGEFRKHLENELQQKTGDVTLNIFQDTEAIRVGDKWQEILSKELASAKLLLILFSPSWIRSAWCRKEYRLFAYDSRLGVLLSQLFGTKLLKATRRRKRSVTSWQS